MEFIIKIYVVTSHYPKFELYSLVDQTRRAASSIALNIAEGSGAGTDKEFARFLRISYRSIYEVITALDIAYSLKYVSFEEYNQLIDTADMLGAMHSKFLLKLRADG